MAVNIETRELGNGVENPNAAWEASESFTSSLKRKTLYCCFTEIGRSRLELYLSNTFKNRNYGSFKGNIFDEQGAWKVKPAELLRRVWRRSRSIERLSFQGLLFVKIFNKPSSLLGKVFQFPEDTKYSISKQALYLNRKTAHWIGRLWEKDPKSK